MAEKVESTPTRTNKKYYNLIFFQISDSMFFTIMYLFTSVFLTIVNKVLFQKFNFKFNLTLMFCQQLFCSIFFNFIAPRFENFGKVVGGEISWADFNRLKGKYVFFSSLFIVNYLSSFYGLQLVVNTAMFLTLRKFSTVMNYLYDKFINKKKLPEHFTQCVIMITVGAFFTGYDDLTSDVIGYVVVFVNNTLSTLYGQFSESFSKKNGIPNVKLIIYNSFLAVPFLLALILLTGEHWQLLKFLEANDTGIQFRLQLFSALFVSCSLAIVLNVSMFISYERGSSLFTQLMAGCGGILASLVSWFILNDFNATVLTILGTILSSGGAVMFSLKAFSENFKSNKKD